MPQKPFSWLNGHALTEADIPLLAGSRALRYGEGAFETMVWEKDRILGWESHQNRLIAARKKLGITDWTTSRPLVEKFLSRHLPAHGPRFWKIRLQIHRGGPPGSPGPADWLLEASPLEDNPWQCTPQRVTVQGFLMPERRFYKPVDYAPWLHAADTAAALGLDDCLLSSGGIPVCSSRANLFFLHEGALCTPPLTTGCIPGTLRQRLLRLGAVDGIPLRELRRYRLENLLRSPAVLLSNALRGCMPVTELDGHPLPDCSRLAGRLNAAVYALSRTSHEKK